MGDILNKGLGASLSATGLSSASQIEPVPVSPVPASIPSAVARIIARRLDAGQRDFILRMKPHRKTQAINKRDYQNIEPCVEYEPDGWPDLYWFGGMRGTFGAGAPRRPYSFTFNEVGLEVRQILHSRTASAPLVAQGTSGSAQDPQGLDPKDAGPVPKECAPILPNSPATQPGDN